MVAHAQIVSAAKLDAGSDAEAIITALQARSGGGTLEDMVSLQSRIQELEVGTKRTTAEAAIDSAIRSGKPIPQSSRDDFIARHMADPERTDFWLGRMVSLHSGGLPTGQVPRASVGLGLDGSEMQIISTLGITPAAFLLTKQAKSNAAG